MTVVCDCVLTQARVQQSISNVCTTVLHIDASLLKVGKSTDSL